MSYGWLHIRQYVIYKVLYKKNNKYVGNNEKRPETLKFSSQIN